MGNVNTNASTNAKPATLRLDRFSLASDDILAEFTIGMHRLAADRARKLVVDVTYQREIGRRGALNVNQIAENFDWSKFAPVIVAPVEGGHFAIVDGQHRTTAAMLRGQEQVPSQIVQADRAKQAAAYAAVNGNITKTTAQQLYHAKAGSQRSECVSARRNLFGCRG